MKITQKMIDKAMDSFQRHVTRCKECQTGTKLCGRGNRLYIDLNHLIKLEQMQNRGNSA